MSVADSLFLPRLVTLLDGTTVELACIESCGQDRLTITVTDSAGELSVAISQRREQGFVRNITEESLAQLFELGERFLGRVIVSYRGVFTSELFCAELRAYNSSASSS